MGGVGSTDHRGRRGNRARSTLLLTGAALCASWLAQGRHSQAAPAQSTGLSGPAQLADPAPPPPPNDRPLTRVIARRKAVATEALPPPSPDPPPDPAAARRLRDGQGAAARPALRAFLGLQPAGRPRARAHYLLGRALLRAGRPREADEHFGEAEESLTAIKDDVLFHRAEAAFFAADLVTARSRYRRLILRHPTSPWSHRARFREADVDLLRGRHHAARRSYTSLLERYPELPGRAAVTLAIGRCLEAVGRKTAAAAQYRVVTLERWDPEIAAQADLALIRLAADGIEPPPLAEDDFLEWGARLHYWKLWPRAEEFLGALVDTLRARRPGWGLRVDAHIERGRNFFDWGFYDDALLEFRAAQGLGAGRRVTRSFARTYERLGRQEEAATKYAQILDGVALHDKLQDMYFDEGRYEHADKHLRTLLELRPGYARKRSYAWRLAWLDYRLGRLKAAAAAFASQAKRKNVHGWRAQYWLARTYQRLERRDEARELFVDLRRRLRIDYYGIQAENRLREMDTLPVEEEPAVAVGGDAPASPRGPSAFHRRPQGLVDTALPHRKTVDPMGLDDFPEPPPSLPVGPERIAARIDWRAGSEREPVTAADGPLPPSTPAEATFERLVERYGKVFPSFRRLRELAVLGDDWQVRRGLEAALREYKAVRGGRSGRNARARAAAGGSFIDHRKEAKGVWGSRIVLSELPTRVTRIDASRRRGLARLSRSFYSDVGEAFAHIGAAHYAKRYLLRGKTYLGTAPDGDYRAHWMRAYPQAYGPIVRRNAARYDVPPNLVWAIMTVESSHYPGAVSRANARGLMQVIPKTGDRIARQMGIRNYSEAALSEPEVALQYGCWYLAQLLTKFRGQEVLAIAAYNGGPHNVQYWLDRKGDLPTDEFIEEIRFTQARGYAKKVLKYLRLYRWIYEGNKTLYVPNALDPRYRGNIRF